MVYPVFEYESIKARCAQDITAFKANMKVEDPINHTLYCPSQDIKDSNSLKTGIKPIIDYLKTNLKYKNTNLILHYLDQISHIDPPLQYYLWIVRTYLFYQLLIYATATFLNKDLYNNVYKDLPQFEFIEIGKDELKNFKMGIFGSMSPTSDIDIGIQYSGTTLHKPALAYIVSRFENLFYIFTGKSSLEWDIETYADMMTLPNPDSSGSDYFYLDSSIFSENEFKKMLPIAGASILRNVALLSKDYKIPDAITYNSIQDSIQKILKTNNMNFTFPEEIQGMLNEKGWWNESKKLVTTFLNMTERDRRYAYYKKVEIAEEEKNKFTFNKNISALSKENICDIMVKIGEALLYRMESYTCAPTVSHVVRILQASKNDLSKYKSITPSIYCNKEIQHLDAFCSIGKYGYVLSILEQMGYAYRFYKTYCISNLHENTEKCNKKIKKYKERYENAIELLNKYTSSVGGYSKKKSKQTKKMRQKQRKTRYTRKIRKSSAKTHSRSN